MKKERKQEVKFSLLIKRQKKWHCSMKTTARKRHGSQRSQRRKASVGFTWLSPTTLSFRFRYVWLKVQRCTSYLSEAIPVVSILTLIIIFTSVILIMNYYRN